LREHKLANHQKAKTFKERQFVITSRELLGESSLFASDNEGCEYKSVLILPTPVVYAKKK
jgi:hypothetical protein